MATSEDYRRYAAECNAGIKAIIDALNVVYDEKEKRGFIKLNLVSLAFTLATLASVLLAVGAVVILPLILGYIGLSDMSSLLLRQLARYCSLGIWRTLQTMMRPMGRLAPQLA
jgi:uncharacterized BrkB/YihY/UPF0761 family membrane protein